MARASVVIPLQWETLSEEQDPLGYVRNTAMAEINLLHEYDASETALVQADPVFLKSTKNAYLVVRKRAERFHRREVKQDPKLEKMEAAWKVRIHYTRPASRDWRHRPTEEYQAAKSE
jgi:hypothetical protein